jgi:hypothetical protein
VWSRVVGCRSYVPGSFYRGKVLLGRVCIQAVPRARTSSSGRRDPRGYCFGLEGVLAVSKVSKP